MDSKMLAFASMIFDCARDGSNGATAELAHYLGNGLTPNMTNASGDTLLLLAAYHQQHANVDLLLEHGADLDRVNDKGQTALAAAVFRDDAGLVRALLAAGASPLAGGPHAIETARYFGRSAMLALLDPAGAG